MGNLSGMTSYQIGAIDRCPDAGKSWRETNKLLLKSEYDVTAIDPHQKPFVCPQEDDNSRSEIARLKKEDKFEEIKERYGYIRPTDLRCVDLSDFLTVYIDINIFICGTMEEIVLANRQKKPVLCVIEGGRVNTPNWLIFMLPTNHIFNDWGEYYYYLNYVDTHPNPTELSRWLIWKK